MFNASHCFAPVVFCTVGHSTRPIGEFVDLLDESAVRLVVDVRSVPRSRRNPQYNRDALPAALAPFDIAYIHSADLGGLRGRDRTTSPDVNGFWENASFHNYADYALSAAFAAALDALREAGHERRCAIMCAEALWWRCHRRIISDYLLANGESVFHIMGRGNIEPAQINPAARPTAEGTLAYPSQAPA